MLICSIVSILRFTIQFHCNKFYFHPPLDRRLESCCSFRNNHDDKFTTSSSSHNYRNHLLYFFCVLFWPFFSPNNVPHLISINCSCISARFNYSQIYSLATLIRTRTTIFPRTTEKHKRSNLLDSAYLEATTNLYHFCLCISQKLPRCSISEKLCRCISEKSQCSCVYEKLCVILTHSRLRPVFTIFVFVSLRNCHAVPFLRNCVVVFLRNRSVLVFMRNFVLS